MSEYIFIFSFLYSFLFTCVYHQGKIRGVMDGTLTLMVVPYLIYILYTQRDSYRSSSMALSMPCIYRV